MATVSEVISVNVNLKYPDLKQVQQAPDGDVADLVSKYFSTQTMIDSYSYQTCTHALSRVHFRKMSQYSTTFMGMLGNLLCRYFAHPICYFLPYKLAVLQSEGYLPENYEKIKRISFSSIHKIEEIVRLFPNAEEVVIHAFTNDRALEALKNCKHLKRLELDYSKYTTEKKVMELMESCPINTLIMKNNFCLTLEYQASLKAKGITVVQTLPPGFYRDSNGTLHEDVDVDIDD